MAKIREDLVGVVSVAGLTLRPGEEVPEGVSVGGHVLAPVKAPEKPKRRPVKPE